MTQFSSTRLILGSALLTGLFLACSSNETSTTSQTGGTSAAGSTGAGAAAGQAAGGTQSGTGGSTMSAGHGGTGTGGSTTGGTGGSTPTTGGASGSGFGTGGTVGGASGMAGTAGSGTMGGAGTSSGTSGSAGSGMMGNCNFTVTSQTADQAGTGGIPTVGIVNWSVDMTGLTKASIDFTLMGGTTTMTAPIDLTTGPNFRTLLLGMKGSKTYTFHVNVTNGSSSCTSQDYTIKTGAIPNAVPRVTRTAGTAVAMQDKGFIVTSSGLAGGLGGGFGGGTMGGGSTGSSAYAYIIDADGDIVWFAPAPDTCSRAKMSYDGQYMWMVELNVDNMTKDGGELRRVSMDGLQSTGKIPGMSNCHHDVTILPDGRAACMSWIQQSGDQPSDLLETDYMGNVKKIVTVDSSIYQGGSGLGGGGMTFHANSIHYHMADDSYTVGDRNPNLFVKLSHAGQVLWQFGGSCTGAPAPKCVPGTWKVNHGHDMLDDGTFLFFNNGQSGPSTAFFYKITETGTFAATPANPPSYSPGTTSSVLGDVQRLPNGNTLVTFSTASVIHEIDPTATNVVQQITGPGGYAEWRETLYGPPPRF
ncbi:MAG TPA: aryl-sulfate sulfotransferase [Polyangiaceae bacterium]|nr:aryl-sulfate sulfotransferase [Polyangiaceae bacterium]